MLIECIYFKGINSLEFQFKTMNLEKSLWLSIQSNASAGINKTKKLNKTTKVRLMKICRFIKKNSLLSKRLSSKERSHQQVANFELEKLKLPISN